MEAVKFIPEKEMALFFDSPSTFRDTGNELTIDINVRWPSDLSFKSFWFHLFSLTTRTLFKSSCLGLIRRGEGKINDRQDKIILGVARCHGVFLKMRSAIKVEKGTIPFPFFIDLKRGRKKIFSILSML